MSFELFVAVFFLIFVAGILIFVLKFIRHGSLTGALLGGSIEKELAEIPLEGGRLSSQSLKVYTLRSPDGASFVGLSIVSKAPLSASMVPYRLSFEQARALSEVLNSATSR